MEWRHEPLEPVLSMPTGADYTGAELVADETLVATFHRSSSIEFFSLDPEHVQPPAELRTPDVAFREFAVSPTQPLLITANTSSRLQSWVLADGGVEAGARLSPGGFSSRLRFGGGGDKLVLLQQGNVVIIEVAGGLRVLDREEGQTGTEACMYGPDDKVAVLTPEHRGDVDALRVLLRQGDAGSWSSYTSVNFEATEPDCATIASLGCATRAERIVIACGGGSLLVVDRPEGARSVRRFVGTERELQVPALSPGGRWLAAAEGARVRVWDLEGRRPGYLLEPGAPPEHYPARLQFAPTGRLLALDRRDAVVVYQLPDATAGD